VKLPSILLKIAMTLRLLILHRRRRCHNAS
jgi:hypothetical protein